MRVHHGELEPLPLPEGHRFPAGKYLALRARLLEERLVSVADLRAAEPAPRALVTAVHDESYASAFEEGRLDGRTLARIGLPWSRGLVERALASVGATVAAARDSLAHGFAASLGGGTHHGKRASGGGYCVLNDLAVAARALIDSGAVARVLVLDLDVHQGDGTASIFEDEPRVFTCSVHGAGTYPVRKARSDIDVELAEGTGDGPYLAALAALLERCLAEARPEAVLYQAGVDVLAEDRLGTLALTARGVEARDRMVFAAARARGIPVALTLGGGYGRPGEATVEAHVGTFRAARSVFGA